MAKRTWFTPRQEQLLEVVSQNPAFQTTFYLTGGTALAACFYNHRESDDLDFFSNIKFPDSLIKEIILFTQSKLRWKTVRRVSKHGHDKYLISWSKTDKLLLDFNPWPYKPFKLQKTIFNIKIESVKDIAINKLDTILTRSAARDYIDLYTIIHREKFSLKKLIKLHLQKIEHKVPLTKFAAAFLKAKEPTDLPKMKIPFSRTKMIKFYEQLAKSLEPEIFK